MANAAAYDIVSVNMSLGDTGNYGTPLTLHGIDDELAALAAMNIVVVSSSGNDFYENDSTQGVGYPAADPNSLSVGAVYDSFAGSFSYGGGAVAFSTGPDRITPFSQRHETLTTIFAPGAPITGAGPTAGLTTMHGTSQASPHVAGIAVLAQQLAERELGRRLTPAEFSNLLQTTGVIINDGDDENDNVTNTNLFVTRPPPGEAGRGLFFPGKESIMPVCKQRQGVEPETMSKFDEQMKRCEAIFGDAVETQEEAIAAFFQHLKANLQLPCEVTGTEDFRWEERYVLGGWSQQEYERLKKTQPSYTDKYDLLDIEQDGWSEWMMFDEDIVANVRRKSDGNQFDLGLAELRVTDKKSPNFQLLDDYAVWLVNNR